MPAWRIFLILSISTCFFLLPVETLNGCGGGDMSYPEDEFSYLIKQELVDAHGYDAFFLYYPSTYYPVGIEEEIYGAEQNLKEWQAFTGNKIL